MCHRHAILEPQTPSADSRGAQNKRQNKNLKTNKNMKLFPPPLLDTEAIYASKVF